MAAAAHNPAFARKAGIKQSVAKEFNAADSRAHARVVNGIAATRKRAMDKIVRRGARTRRAHMMPD